VHGVVSGEIKKSSPGDFVCQLDLTDHVSTISVERQNLTMKMGMRCFTRLTNAFSKNVENHAHQVALHFMHYNFCRIHKTLPVTPASEAGIRSRVDNRGDVRQDFLIL